MRNTDPIEALKHKPPALVPDPWKMRCARALRDLSTRELAAALGWGKAGWSTIVAIETYTEAIGRKRTAQIARVLRVSEASLYSDAAGVAAGRDCYRRWAADGRPELGEWLRAGG